MKKIVRFRHLLMLLLSFCWFSMSAQNRITGTVSDNNSSSGIPGVSILVKGTKTGTTTDAQGKFAINAPANGTLIFSLVGYSSKEVSIGNQSVINVSMTESTENLEEVVVTALGIKKEAKKLGYATTTVASKEVQENRSPNFMNALQGKVAGVNISAMGTGPAGTSKVRIRGQSSLSGQNNPLIVLNGVPIDNTNFGVNPNNQANDTSIPMRGGGVTSDGGDGLSSINPDDIESMTVLKGATAAALYGSRAKDGVIMITTKSKGDSRGIGVTVNSNFTNETPLDFTDYQYEYGQGENGRRPTAPNPTSGQWSFGEKFQPGMTQILFDGVEVPYVPVFDRFRKFYRDGQNFTNTVSLSSLSEKGGLNLSVSNLDSKGIVPNNSFNRKTINLGFSYELSKKLSFAGNVNYSNETNLNPPNIANQDNSIPTSLSNLANSMPLELLDQKKYNAAGNEFIYSRFQNRTNPYWVLAEQFQNIRRDRIFGNISAKYNLTPWLNVQARIGQDFWSRDQDYNNFPTGHASQAAAPAGFVNGSYTQNVIRFRETNADILINGSKKFGNIGIDFNLGGNQMYRRFENNSVFVQDFVVRGLYTVMNSRLKDPLYTLSERAVNSVYGSGEVSYKDYLFLNVTARNDWFSTLSPEERSIMYPSASVSWVFSQMFDRMPDWLNFGKLRVAFADVGSDTDVSPYSQSLYYGINANLFNGQPVGSSQGNTLPSSKLRPMRTSEKEIGLELKTLNSRLNFDLAVYERITDDQIVNAQISDASGFTTVLINSGTSRNQGFEALINMVPIKKNGFQWDLTLNASYNATKVLKLTTDDDGTPEKDVNGDKQAERITTGTHVFNGELRQVVGQEMAQIYGYGFRRDAQGRIIHGANGIPLRTPDLISYGSALPKWVGGITNTFQYKNLSVSALIDFKLGGKMLSGTNFNAVRHGLHKMTLPGRSDGGIVGEGVNEAGAVNAVRVNPQDYWSVVRSLGIVEPVVYDAGYWKLRQVTIGYDLSKFIPKSFPIKGAKVSFVANNVFMLQKWADNIDPESFGYSSDNIVGMESTGVPTTRSMGFNVNLKF
jgi:TonB-linked SusC/RagA family outer membrane protein